LRANRVPIRLPLIALGIGLAAVFATACGSSDDTAPEGAKTLSFKLTDQGCDPANAKVPAGPVSFEVENAGTSKVTEFEVLDGDEILGEKENLSDGFSGDFSLTLEEGTYTLYCPGGEQERGTLTVTAR
jgi:iron uptake system component EfeO